MSVRHLSGDCRAILPTLPAESVHCVVTSPPYYALRDYQVAGQIGLEQTPDAYVAELVGVFREVRHVLRRDGTAWINLGDGFGPGKQLQGIPWKVAFALQADGWILRMDCIWSKPNPMPESVTDRPTRAHEYLFLLSRSARYFYDAEAIREDGEGRLDRSPGSRGRIGEQGWSATMLSEPAGRNRRSVWTVATQPFSDWGYDFEAADYVDDRGIPRKWSPDCPIHAQDGQPRRENPVTAFYDEPRADDQNGNAHIDDDPDLARSLDASATEHYRSSTDQDIPSDGQHLGNHSSKITDPLPHEVEGQTHSRTTGIQESRAPSTTDFAALSYSRPARRRSTYGRKNDLDAPTFLDGIVSEELVSHTENMAPRPSVTGPDASICGSNTSPCNDRQKSPAGIRSGKNDKSPSTLDKCVCQISQTSHFATFPPALIEPCIKAGVPERCCAKCGAPWVREVGDSAAYSNFKAAERMRKGGGMRSNDLETLGLTRGTSNKSISAERITLGFSPSCACEAGTVPGTVLDPFGGAGTTGMVADRLQRNAILIELSTAYASMATNRISNDRGGLLDLMQAP